MSYNIPSKSKAIILAEDTKIELFKITPTTGLSLKHILLTVFLKGHIGSSFKMKINIYSGDGSLLMSSAEIGNDQIQRSGDYYCELRFDFPQVGNLLGNTKSHSVEFEILDGYSMSVTDYVAIMMQTNEELSFLGSDSYIVENSLELMPVASIFTDVMNPSSSEKFLLMKMDAVKLLSSMTYTTQNHGPSHKLYTFNVGAKLNISGLYLEEDGVSPFVFRVYDEIVPNPANYSSGNNSFFYDPKTGSLSLYTTVFLDSSCVLLLSYSLHFTNHRGRYIKSSVTSGDDVYWEPRLYEEFQADYSQQNNLQGTLSVSSSSISLKNNDLGLNKYMSRFDSFSNRRVKIWRGQGESFKRIYDGTVRGIAINDMTVDLGTESILAVLDEKFNDGKRLSYIGMYPSIDGNKWNKIIPRTFGKVGPYNLEFRNFAAYPTVFVPVLEPSKMLEATCVSFTPALSTTVNRKWSLGFGGATMALTTLPVASHTSGTTLYGLSAESVITLDMGLLALGGITTARQLFAAGDTFKQGSQYGIIHEVRESTLHIFPYNASLNTDDITRSRVTLIIESNAGRAYPVAIRDYSASMGVQGDMQITFVNGFEATVGIPTLDPNNDRVYFRIWNDEAESKASEIMKQMVGYSGLDYSVVDDFAPDQSTPWIDPQLSFSIPFAETGERPTYREIFEKILKTSMGFIYFDDLGFVKYKSFMRSITPEIEELTPRNSTDFYIQFDFYDLYSGVEFNFSHGPNVDSYKETFGQYGLRKVELFYNTSRKYQVESLIDFSSPDISEYFEEFISLACGRSAIFNISAFDDHLDSLVGDDVKVTRDAITDDVTSDMRIISIGKAINSVKISLVDLKRFPGL